MPKEMKWVRSAAWVAAIGALGLAAMLELWPGYVRSGGWLLLLLPELAVLAGGGWAVYHAEGGLLGRIAAAIGLILAAQCGGFLLWQLNFGSDFAGLPLSFISGWALLQFVAALGAMMLLLGLEHRSWSEKAARRWQVASLPAYASLSLLGSVAVVFEGFFWLPLANFAVWLWLGCAIAAAPWRRKCWLVITLWASLLGAVVIQVLIGMAPLFRLEVDFRFGIAAALGGALLLWGGGTLGAWRAEGAPAPWSRKVCRAWWWGGLLLLLLETVKSLIPLLTANFWLSLAGGDGVIWPAAWICCGIGWYGASERERLLLAGMTALFFLSGTGCGVPVYLPVDENLYPYFPWMLRFAAVAGTMAVLGRWQRQERMNLGRVV